MSTKSNKQKHENQSNLSMRTMAVIFISISGFLFHEGFAQTNSDSAQIAEFLRGKNYRAIKLEKYPTGHLVTRVKLNGVKGLFILDTGAGATIVENERKDKFLLSIQSDTIKAYGAGGSSMAVQTSAGNTLELDGDYKEKDFTLKLISLENVNGALRRLKLDEVDGIIGADILTQRSALIDYKNLVLYLKL